MPARVKKAQVTIFVIIAILIVASVSLFFFLKVKPSAVPAQFKPIEDYFLGCIENKVKDGASLLGSQGGYIEPPKFEPGSSYMPFSSQFDFLGNPVPYWFYISRNNIMRQQVPSLSGMEKQLSNFLDEEIKNCEFSEFEKRGYTINVESVKTNAKINDQDIAVSVNAPLIISYGDSSGRITSHNVDVRSKTGKFYKIAKKIYDTEQEDLFLENYSVDVLNLYAPVTNVELSCSPKIWMRNDVEKDLKNALSANMGSIKIKGSYYKAGKDDKYFAVDTGSNADESINVLYSPSWTTKIDIWPNDGAIMTAEPVGNQKGLGILGFCYVPYHFVYDVAFPVMIQIYNENEFFQFPVIAMIEKNKVRGTVPKEAEGMNEIETGMCGNKAANIGVRTVDSNFNPVEAKITFKCLNEECEIGKTIIRNGEAVLEAKMPPCVGATIVASAEGYADGKMPIDTNEEGGTTIIMSKLYKLNLELSVGGVPISSEENAFITLDSGDEVINIAYPQQKTIELKEGYYNITAQVYRKGNLVIGSQKTTQCIKVPASGLGGFFGMQREECYNIEIPSQTLTQILEGGGSTAEYLTEDMLKSSKKLIIGTSIFSLPKTIFDLQNTYDEVENSGMDIGLG